MLKKIIRERDAVVVWEGIAYNDKGQLTQSKRGHNILLDKTYYPETGLLQTTICNNVQSFEYAYDNLGNMTDRYDHFHKTNSQSLHEEFGYDDRNQLTSVTLNGASPRIFEYDALGNIESNPDAGAFDYTNPGKPYQMASLTPNSNLAPGYQTRQEITYTHFNKVETITANEHFLELTYGLDQQRISQKLYEINRSNKRFILEKQFIAGVVEKVIFADQTTKTINYITSPEGIAAIEITANPGEREWYWVFTDHLGSITTLVRNSDRQKFEMSFDAWGNRRDPATWETYTNNMPTFITDRGYTGHEHLDEFSLINMNGRLYDPQTTRFLSPDPFITDPGNPAGYNPYAYVLNNPLKYTDPSGYFVDPVSIAAYVIAAAIIYSNAAKINGDPATGKYEWNMTKWFGKDKPGFGGIGYMSNSSFTNSTYFVSISPTNGSGGTVGYNTQYGWGSGSSPQDIYFPNHNSGASEAAAVNNIVNAGNFNFSSSQGSYMDALIYNTMTKTTVLAFNQYHVVSSIGPLGPSYYGSDGGIYFANSTAGFESTMTHPSYAPGYVPPSLSSSGEINIFEPNIFESFATSKIGSTFIGRIAYGIVDDGWVTMCCLTIGHKNAFHINGAGVIGNETVNSGLNTLTSFVPLSSTSKFLGMGTKTLNAGQFNKLYKGTGVTAAKNNGVFIRQFNGNIRQSNNFNFLWNYFLNPTTYSLGYMNIK